MKRKHLIISFFFLNPHLTIFPHRSLERKWKGLESKSATEDCALEWKWTLSPLASALNHWAKPDKALSLSSRFMLMHLLSLHNLPNLRIIPIGQCHLHFLFHIDFTLLTFYHINGHKRETLQRYDVITNAETVNTYSGPSHSVSDRYPQTFTISCGIPVHLLWQLGKPQHTVWGGVVLYFENENTGSPEVDRRDAEEAWKGKNPCHHLLVLQGLQP